jgi:phosphoglycerate kinase
MVAECLSGLLGRDVHMMPDSIGEEVSDSLSSLIPGDVALLENLRFHKGEEKNDPEFARALASLADAYVNDAFGACHREHASVSTEITKQFENAAGAGHLLAEELQKMGHLIDDQPSSFCALLGGAKVKDKIPIIDSLLDRVNTMLIGGGMSYTFHLALGRKIGESICQPEYQDICKGFLDKAERNGVNMLIPVDHVIAPARGDGEPIQIDITKEDIPDGWEGFDIGQGTTALFLQHLQGANYILWNGPVGLFERPPFEAGTKALAQNIAGMGSEVYTVLGGGDTIASINEFGLNSFYHISTGGGASLEYLAGLPLPGILALPEKD